MSTTATNPFNDFVFLNATPSDRGSFTLALDKALDKLEKFQLPDPSFFILQWVQALVASGAQTIRIGLDTSRGQYDMKIAFDGPGYTAKELQGLYDHVFLSGRDRGQDRLRELALGWLSASSLKPSRLMISSNGWSRVRDKATGAGKAGERTSQLPEEVEAGPGHRLEIAGRGSYNFEHMLTTSCTDVPIVLQLNGTQISHPNVSTGVPWPNRPFENGPTRGVMGATYGAGSVSQIAFLRYGVNFVSRAEPGLQPPVIVRASDSTLSKNVSQTDVVRDEAYDEFLARMRSEMKTMALSLTGKRIPSYQRDSLNRYLQAFIGSHLDIRALEDPNRLKLLGADYEALLHYPVFCTTKGVYRSLIELHGIYKKQGSLLYCLEPAARAVPWAGILLVLEPEEVHVLRKFFPNLQGLTLEEIRVQTRMGRSASGVDFSKDEPVLARRDFQHARRTYNLVIPDTYPTGTAVLRAWNSQFGTTLPGLNLTMTIEFTGLEPPDHTEVASLQRAVLERLHLVKVQLEHLLEQTSASGGFSRLRAAELYCEMLNFELKQAANDTARQALVRDIVESKTPLIGLEDGKMVSFRDVTSYLKLVPHLYLGGAFVEGLESGALDPMPQATHLLNRLYPSHSLIPTERVRGRLQQDPELRFEFRRQVVMRGLGAAADPRRVLEQFASEAAEEAAELARIEREYRKALEAPTLFVKPDEERLAELAALDEEMDSAPLLLDLIALQPNSAEANNSQGDSATPRPAPSVPSLEADAELCRYHDPDLFPERDSLQVEQWEKSFSLRLATCAAGQGRLLILEGQKVRPVSVPQPVRGFVRCTDPTTATQLLQEGLEQLTVRVMNSFSDGPGSSRLRRALRSWLLHRGCDSPDRLRASVDRPNDLFDLPVVPCLGGKYLSWRTLLEQAQRVGETVLHEGSPEVPPAPGREVIVLTPPLSAELLQGLSFPPVRRYSPTSGSDPFDELYRSTRRDLASVLSGQSTPLLQTNLVEQLAGDASLWKRWRSGFLSWDRDQAVVVMNPRHKVGAKLAQAFAKDPSWSRIFASALFSTINRGLEEVEDRHERTFLESLVDTLD